MDKEVIAAVALGIGLSASAGFRVFVPLFVASIAAHVGFLPVTDSFQWLASWPAMICFGTSTVVEILAYYIPVVDNLLDSITTPLSVVAGTLMLTSVLPVDNELLKWIGGFIFGGGTAATIQAGSVITRLASTKLTAGTANHAVATGEHTAAIGTSLLSLLIPVFVATLVILLMVFILFRLRKKFHKKQHP
ncbi:MAG: DUF4126 domain-containing protein [Bacteroidales bacterium]|nr:DUF4126 domain-containing protein [Bacteroidales bacterium]